MNKKNKIKHKISNKYRFCHCCQEIKKFEINFSINHSECKYCGARFGIKRKNKVQSYIQKRYNKEFKKLNIWFENQKELLKKIDD